MRPCRSAGVLQSIVVKFPGPICASRPLSNQLVPEFSPRLRGRQYPGALTPASRATARSARNIRRSAAAVAVGLYMRHNVFYASVAFIAGWLADRLAKKILLSAGYFLAAVMAVSVMVLPLGMDARIGFRFWRRLCGD